MLLALFNRRFFVYEFIALENKGHDVAGNPGLIAVLCIFFITVAILLVIVIVKVVRARRPQFERLDDVPMVGLILFQVITIIHITHL